MSRLRASRLGGRVRATLWRRDGEHVPVWLVEDELVAPAGVLLTEEERREVLASLRVLAGGRRG